MVKASGSTSSSSSQANGVDTCAPGRARTDHAPNTVLWGAFWLKSTKIRCPPFLLPPRRGDQVRGGDAPAPGPRRPRRLAHRWTTSRACEAHVDVDAPVAGGLGPGNAPRARRDRARAPRLRRLDGPGASSVPGDGSRSMRSSSAWSGSAARLGQTWKPRQPRLTAQTTWARSARPPAPRRWCRWGWTRWP